MHRIWLWLAASGCVLLAGCGPSPQAVVQQHRPAYDALRDKLARIAAKIPPVGQVSDQSDAPPLAPPLVLAVDDDASNCEGIMFEQLTAPDARPPLDLFLSHRLTTALFWTSPVKQADELRSGDVRFMERTLAGGLGLKYLVVHRVAKLELPQAVDRERFRGGRVTLEGLVFDLDREEAVASYVVTAQTAAEIDYSYREGESAERQLESFAHSSLWTDARERAARRLAETTGGTVRLTRP